MQQDWYSADEVAERLGLHVRTVRGYVRDGRLAAVRIGKQYRIAREDLEAFVGRPAPSTIQESTTRQRVVEVSSAVEISAVDRRTVDRISTLLSSANAHQRAGDDRLRIQAIYDEERAHLKVVVFGSLITSANVFEMIEAILDDGNAAESDS
mgnify:CR=1 FL=1